MKNQVDVKIKGIKCDNKCCDYKNTSVCVEDYKEWVNKPCPKCGSVLLTESDYKFAKFIIKLVGFINKILPKRKDSAPDTRAVMFKDSNGKLITLNIEESPDPGSII